MRNVWSNLLQTQCNEKGKLLKGNFLCVLTQGYLVQLRYLTYTNNNLMTKQSVLEPGMILSILLSNSLKKVCTWTDNDYQGVF